MTSFAQSHAGSPAVLGLLLFVPANRPERLRKASAAGADGLILDLEDAVAENDKDFAREGLQRAMAGIAAAGIPMVVRINAAGSPWHEADVNAISSLPVAGVVLPKAERVEDLMRLSRVLGSRERIIALVETARGVASVRQFANATGRIAFGSLDYAADIGAANTRDALLCARAEIVLASRLAGLQGPIDGVTRSIDAAEEVQADAAYAAALGFTGKLLIHPKQVAPAARGLRPSEGEIVWARRIIDASANSNALSVVDGCMVDAPVRAHAERILRRAAAPYPTQTKSP